MDEEVLDVILPRETSDAVLNSAFTNVNLTIDRLVDVADVEEIENIEKIYTEAEKIFNHEKIDDTEKTGMIFENLDYLDKKVKEFRENGKKTLATKCEITSDKIQTKIIKQQPKYPITINAIRPETRSNILVQLERLKKWIRKHFFVVAGITGVVAGVISLIITIVKFAPGGATVVAKTAGGIGKTIAKILAKLSPIASNIGSIILSILSLLAQSLMFVANNLWIILIAVGMFLYREWRNKK